MKRFSTFFLIAIVSFMACGWLFANSEVRDWRMENGDVFNAQIQSVDEKNEKLVLRNEQGEERTVSFSELNKLDRAWVIEWIEMNEEMADKVKALGGKLERFEGKGAKFSTPFYVYHPSGDTGAGKPRPMMVLFDPSGNPVRYLLRHIEAADAEKITLVSCEYFRNRRPVEEMNMRYEDVMPVIRSVVPHDAEQLLLGGTSGGALSAFCLAAKFPEIKVAGIYSNGGWLGRHSEARRPYPACRVAMVNGDKDEGAGMYLDSATAILQERGCTVSLYAFEGGHQIPPPSVQAKSFRWLCGKAE